eukprot:TRINITY_DN1307_c0_g1_i1.p1 TRINITY_DN1307_c0_g1~~TRINITY_DN1307_c0_g1_i1.p1  ORF type:complete len:147 (-),score=27.69 TRINITY_DN1307_c0_g1_i1:334-774(-)
MNQANILAIVSGLFFGAGWWIWIDGASYASYTNEVVDVTFGFHVPGIIATIAFFMVNIVPYEAINADPMMFTGTNVAVKAKAWLFFSFLVLFGSLIAAIWVFVEKWGKEDPKSDWPGIALILQVAFIFLSTILYRIGPGGKSENDI